MKIRKLDPNSEFQKFQRFLERNEDHYTRKELILNFFGEYTIESIGKASSMISIMRRRGYKIYPLGEERLFGVPKSNEDWTKVSYRDSRLAKGKTELTTSLVKEAIINNPQNIENYLEMINEVQKTLLIGNVKNYANNTKESQTTKTRSKSTSPKSR